MAIQILKDNTQSSFPKQITCPHCTSELKVGSWNDVKGERGVQYNESVVTLWIQCPCCRNRISLNEGDFTQHEVNLICQA